jgi:hypothetical protein
VKKHYEEKSVSKIFSIINFFLLIFILLITFDIISINPQIFDIFGTIIKIDPSVVPLNHLIGFIISITIPISFLVWVGILIILYEKENKLISKQILTIFLIMLLIFLLPVSEIIRVGGVFIIFVLYFVIISIESIMRLIDKCIKRLVMRHL